MDSSFVIGIGQEEERAYTVNGVRYVVSSRFKPFSKEPNLQERFKRVLSSNIVPLKKYLPLDTMTDEYVCSAVGKED